MNYYPYFSGVPYMAKPGLFKSLFGGINLSSILSGTQKTLNIVNQTIPIIKQAKPVFNNAKTMFKVINEFRKPDNKINAIKETKSNHTNFGPTFFQ